MKPSEIIQQNIKDIMARERDDTNEIEITIAAIIAFLDEQAAACNLCKTVHSERDCPNLHLLCVNT